MAIATYTASLAAANAPMLYRETGMQARYIQFVGSANTLSDIVLLMPLPDQTRILDFYGTIKSGEALNIIKLGVTGAETALGTFTASASVTQAFNARTLGYRPQVMSLSDDVDPQRGYLYATLSAGSFTTSWTLDLTVYFTNEGGQ